MIVTCDDDDEVDHENEINNDGFVRLNYDPDYNY